MHGWAVSRCERCGVRFTAETPTDDQVQAIYNDLYSETGDYQMLIDELRRYKETGKGGSGLYRSRIFLNRYSPQPGDRLLDVGCGAGAFMLAARERGWEVEGIDLSETAVRASKDVHGLPVRAGSFDELDFEEGAYGALTAWEVLMHLPDPRAFLLKARSLLRPGGVFVASVPNEGSKVPYGVRGPSSGPPVLLNFWDRRSLERFFELNGFRVERAITQRTMLSIAHPRAHPLRFLRHQAGALLGLYEGIHLFVAATPAD
jgi:2-polyprenyl-3-methyl-5-hydroxy-6-metoxy-1,4-benzoquinol methylase